MTAILVIHDQRPGQTTPSGGLAQKRVVTLTRLGCRSPGLSGGGAQFSFAPFRRLDRPVASQGRGRNVGYIIAVRLTLSEAWVTSHTSARCRRGVPGLQGLAGPG